jgi:hypothetical protein
MSALPPKADIGGRRGHVRFVPQADIRSELSHWHSGFIVQRGRQGCRWSNEYPCGQD